MVIIFLYDISKDELNKYFVSPITVYTYMYSDMLKNIWVLSKCAKVSLLDSIHF